jgi:hypothetical protein
MTRLLILSLSVCLGLAAPAPAQEKQAKPEQKQAPALPANVADWSIKQLLENYDPTEADNKVGRELQQRGRGLRFVIFKADRTVDVKSSEFLFRELKKGFKEREWYRTGGTVYKTYPVGVEPDALLDENPLFPGQALRPDESCQKTERKWAGIPQSVRQVLYLAITNSKELQVEKVGDAHDILDRLMGKDSTEAEAWAKVRYPKAYRLYGALNEQNQLPALKIVAASDGSARSKGPGWQTILGTWESKGDMIAGQSASTGWAIYEWKEDLKGFAAAVAQKKASPNGWAGFSFCASGLGTPEKPRNGYHCIIFNGEPQLFKEVNNKLTLLAKGTKLTAKVAVPVKVGRTTRITQKQAPVEWQFIRMQVQKGTIIIQRSADNANYTTVFNLKDDTFTSGRFRFCVQENNRSAEFRAIEFKHLPD